MIDFNQLIKVGRISKAIGYEGSVKFEADYDLTSLSGIEFIFVNIDGDFVPFKLIDFAARDKRNFTIDLDFVNDEKDADVLIMKDIFISKNELAKIDDTSSEVIKIIGYKVFDISGEFLGNIVSVNQESINELLIVENENGEILIPFAEDIILEINESEKEIKVDLPEGLKDLNL
jgi:16S rRNA processing protein RimM